MLTDRAVHRVNGGNPTAATAFATALTAEFPAWRGIAGRSRVRGAAPASPEEQPQEAEPRPEYRRRQVVSAPIAPAIPLAPARVCSSR
ncbi:hypothetical protein ACFWWM_06710 [Streptomyces sp. NPDC058682]|uniref:hypothetical protein n=1 Tax=Streptomyces sp. NPDC058682 TaxID=3346596 RepID=UPI00364852D7